MKIGFKLLIVFFLGMNISFGSCHIELASSVGTYLNELEKKSLRKYQNSSACEVLDYEYSRCSEVQKLSLKKKFNVKEVLGNYCQPFLPPPRGRINIEAMKGMNLYSWKDINGYMWYAILPGTNRLKTESELLENKMTEGRFFTFLKGIKKRKEVSWNFINGVEKGANLNFKLPPKKIMRKISSYLILN